MTFAERLTAEYDHEMANARKMLESVPEDKLAWKPHEKSMTLGRLASHVADFPTWALTTIQVDRLDMKAGDMPAPINTKAEILEKFDKDLKKGRDAIAGLKEDQLDKNWSLSFDGQQLFELPRADVLRQTVMNHLVHHRGQLSVYLRLLNVPVPGMYGPSADEMPPQS